RGATILVSEPGYEIVGSKDLTCKDWMVNTRTDTNLSAAVQNALQTLLPQIREEIREEFCTGSGSSNAGGNPPPRGVIILVSEPGYETVGSKDLTCEDWMVNTRTDVDLSAAVQNALQTLLPRIREEIREEFRTGSGSSNAGRNPPPVTIHTWLERFNKQKPHSFEKATAPVEAENWISHMKKIFNVMGCEDDFKTRLAVYKFEGNALAWWKAYKQAKGGDAWLVTVTWADFKKLFFLQFFPRAEQERLKREYHSIRQTSTWIKPHSFEKAIAPVDAENWISHMEKIFDVMGCEDAFKTRLAVYKCEGNALVWWKAYKQAKGGDAWLVTVTWADFKKLFFLQFFPRAE
nr:zinc finger, CCHC-type, retrotransposon Gag domain protein [Tanacetum cinerariifolium]